MNWIMIGFILTTIVLYSVMYFVNPKNVKTAFTSTFYQLFHPSEGFMYLILASFLISSMLILILPKEQVANWIGKESGLKGITIGSLIGAITPGGPMLTFPILVAFYRAGTGIGAIIAYLTAWSLLGVQRIFAWELPFLGAKIVLVRVAISLIVPIVLGLAGQFIYNKLAI